MRTSSVRTRSELRKAIDQLRKNGSAVAGGIVLTVIILTAVLAPVLAPDDPIRQDYWSG